jgi:hypothetical protein
VTVSSRRRGHGWTLAAVAKPWALSDPLHGVELAVAAITAYQIRMVQQGLTTLG